MTFHRCVRPTALLAVAFAAIVAGCSGASLTQPVPTFQAGSQLVPPVQSPAPYVAPSAAATSTATPSAAPSVGLIVH